MKICLRVLILLFCAQVSAKEQRPNILFIMADDLGWQDVGFSGAKFFETPNIDRLSRSGVRFTDGYAACPVCSPTRSMRGMCVWPITM